MFCVYLIQQDIVIYLHSMKTKITLTLLLAICFQLTSLTGQTWPLSDIEVMKDNTLLHNGLSGGFNAPQFYAIDINRDDLDDLLVFDRDGFKTLVFEAQPQGGCVTYRLNDKLASHFPFMREFVIPKDYNDDDVPDLFTYALSGVAGLQVYKGIDSDDHLEFELVILDQNYQNVLAHEVGNMLSNISISRIDLPAIVDMDGDSDLDILTFPSSGGRMNLFHNLQADRNLADDAIVFELVDDCWGGFYESDFSEEIFLSAALGDCASPFNGGADTRHNGSTTLVWDPNRDGLPDVLIGDFTSHHLVYLQNGGNLSTAWMTAQDFMFPSYDVSVDVSTFLASFYLDVNCDGKKDLLISPNIANASLKTDNVFFYENTGVNKDSFEFKSNSFLAETMIDFGKRSAPSVVDLNADGFLDLVVGVAIDFDNPNAEPTGLISLLHNGDQDEPRYVVDDMNYLELSVFANGSRAFAPTFADMDDDGDMDILVGDEEGFLFFGENTAGVGNPVNIPSVQYGWMSIDAGQFATPTVADLNGDGLPDLIIGEKNPNNDISTNMICGNINYYQNIGSATSPNFISNSETPPNTNCLGQINTKYVNNISGSAAPSFYNTGDSLIMITGVNSGTIARHRVGAVGEIFPAIDTLLGQLDEGTLSKPVLADLDNDDVLEIILGNQRGGIAIYDTPIRTNGSLITASRDVVITQEKIFPNPIRNGQQIFISHVKGSYSFQLIGLNGEVYYSSSDQVGDMSFLLPHLNSGLYLLVLKHEKGVESKKIVVLN